MITEIELNCGFNKWSVFDTKIWMKKIIFEKFYGQRIGKRISFEKKMTPRPFFVKFGDYT